ncbi:PIN domain nuclease [Streptomyces fulvoviolaceus]|uniref:PIN domain nuclease n=1 Tax=Streptomyces fulvoviolaceus TaxID=285535 RepID=UPI0004C9E696|nr:PIN domain nuclease [Streptomyces fulvoviolaceus]MCT9081178.1 PIN domain nuclease [Streptomyces fulvoviolaceus]
MTVADYLIDTSALARVLLGQNTTEWEDRITGGLVAICDITELEVLYSARSAGDHARLKAALDAHYAWCPMPDGIYRRSRVIQEQLTAKGEHRSAGPVDLLVAATAEEAGLTLLHYDRDFDTIARTTGQPVRAIDLK